MDATIEFSPGILNPTPFDVQKRIQELRGYLDPKDPTYQPEQQHKNIKAAIKLYEDGKIDGVEQVFIKDGKIVPKEEIFKGGAWSICEGRSYQRAQKHAYGHGPFGVNFHELSVVRELIPALGGDGTAYGITVLNDTGSDRLTLVTTDFLRLGNTQGYAGWLLPSAVTDASGNITIFQTILVEVRLVRDNGTPWGNWIPECGIVRQAGTNLPRLSGVGIRDALYIGTAPGNHLLAVGATKGGMASLL